MTSIEQLFVGQPSSEPVKVLLDLALMDALTFLQPPMGNVSVTWHGTSFVFFTVIVCFFVSMSRLSSGNPPHDQPQPIQVSDTDAAESPLLPRSLAIDLSWC